MNFLRKGAAYLGLIKSIEKISEHKDISLNEEMFQKIDEWKALYKAYHEPFHKVTYQTIEGQKTRKMDTLMMPKVASEEMALLVYNVRGDISIDDVTVSDVIEDVLKNDKVDEKFQDYFEYSFAHGGMVINPYIEIDKIVLSFV